jgi:hypothetical protein
MPAPVLAVIVQKVANIRTKFKILPLVNVLVMICLVRAIGIKTLKLANVIAPKAYKQVVQIKAKHIMRKPVLAVLVTARNVLQSINIVTRVIIVNVHVITPV